MNIRNLFQKVSVKMRADFEATKEVRHNPGKGTNREDTIREYLNELLPERYALGKGEIVTAENEHSGEVDIVIFDKNGCPRLLYDESHALFPIEVVFGVISVKSTLSSDELKDAYGNIVKAKKLAKEGSFSHSPTDGMQIGLRFPEIVGVIVAYEAGRTLKTIAEQMEELDAKLDNLEHRPDFVVVLDEGIIGPSSPLRGEFNQFSLPKKEELYRVRKTKRHTWLRFYMQLFGELDSITLPPFDMDDYLKMPERIDGHKVSRHDRFLRMKDGKYTDEVRKLNAKGIKKILDYCANLQPKTQGEIMKEQFGQLPMGMNDGMADVLIYEYNPRNLPPLDPSKIVMKDGRPVSTIECFHPAPIEIDDQNYNIDLGAFDEDDFDIRTDMGIDELFSD